MKAGHILLSADRFIPDLLLGQKALIAECVFDLVAVMPCFPGTQDGLYRWQGHFPDPLKHIGNLLAFILQLFFIRQHLPLTTTTYPEMGAEGLDPFAGELMDLQHHAFSPVLFVLQEAHIHQVTGHHAFHKNHFPVHPGQALSFGGIVIHPDILQYDIFLLFSHAANIPKRLRPAAGIFLPQGNEFSVFTLLINDFRRVSFGGCPILISLPDSTDYEKSIDFYGTPLVTGSCGANRV